MKRTELKLIIEEEIHKIVKEEGTFPYNSKEPSKWDKMYKNTDDDITIVDVSYTDDNSGPYSTTATSYTMLYIESLSGEKYSIEDIHDWAVFVPRLKSVGMVTKKWGLEDIYNPKPGLWTLEFKTIVWQN